MKHSYFPYTRTYKQKTQHPSHSLHNIHHTHYTNMLQHYKAKNTIFNNGCYTTNMRHIHTSIVSRQEAITKYCAHLHYTLAALKRYFPTSHVAPLPNSQQINHPSSKYTYTVNAKTHPSPLCPLCNIHTHNTHHLFNCTHIRTTLSPLDLWTNPACTAGQ